ncbi:nucleotidyltransferase family protein [Cytobacillus dafuensis]|uniref:Nucleotidyltransferase family protein n=1 Tax=Cytobacillus dafuensis TaxID=1742359 RepID=A0A5B8Z4D5_CYTDA|nr:nucleotidyltransferase family protein [Cytobacillus dafuensis]QED47727.1 nucleotidyltransferase family protein [Cytobacillus dafuensis]
MIGTAILLAAGQSKRMQPLTHKGLLSWEGKTLFEHQLQMLLQSSLSDIIVILGHEAELFLHIANKYPVKTIYNENFKKGKCSSIICGLQAANKDSKMILVSSVDQPVDYKIINQLVLSMKDTDQPISIPINKGKRGHPILFSRKIISDLLLINEKTQGLRNIIRKYENQIIEVPIDSILIGLNINTPEDYQNAMKINLCGN